LVRLVHQVAVDDTSVSGLSRLALNESEGSRILLSLESETTDNTASAATLGLGGPIRDVPRTIGSLVVRLEKLILENGRNSLSGAETGGVIVNL
jgi:hypothetical protein